MSIDESAKNVTSDAGREREITLRSPVDRYCRNCQEVALVYDTATDGARCRACGELDVIATRTRTGDR